MGQAALGVWLADRAVASAEATAHRAPLRAGHSGRVDGDALPHLELDRPSSTRFVGSYGWGRIDMVENRRVGIKSREVYECPGALALMMAHADLESITLERDLAREKARLEPRYAELVYDGLWFSPLSRRSTRSSRTASSFVTGDVRLRLEPGQCLVSGRRSPHALYDYGLATYDADDSVPPRGLRRLRAPLGPRRRDLGAPSASSEPSSP